ncbi:DUF1223 domain-containing protein [uncultured Brevundimonas sp.]|uniref:DUF1223 domain-containing protein n=1 Tax=uncultured Brevundimonas sp. TaxID=213418 RepID=UPI002604F6B9|nr:DUF1223 domain-containing protein [uncultured Brevundimonas sp.]
MSKSSAPAVFLSALMALSALPAAASAPPSSPVVVELFTAQGCTACPDANRSVARLGQERDIVVLTYNVDYWDYLGWQDTYARPEFVQRQRAYRQALGQRSLATPQVVIAGHENLDPSRESDLHQKVLSVATPDISPPDIEFRETGDRVGIGSGRVPEGGAEVVAVRYSPGMHNVTVRTGDNRGRSVSHMNVVRAIYPLGDWNGRSSLYELPPAARANGSGRDAVIVLLQSKTTRQIIASAMMPELRPD